MKSNYSKVFSFLKGFFKGSRAFKVWTSVINHIGLKELSRDDVSYLLDITKKEIGDFSQSVRAFTKAKEVFRNTSFNKCNSILDVGGGDGRILVQMGKLYGAKKLVLVDPIKPRHIPKNVEYYKDLKDVPQHDFDLITFLQSIHHFEYLSHLRHINFLKHHKTECFISDHDLREDDKVVMDFIHMFYEELNNEEPYEAFYHSHYQVVRALSGWNVLKESDAKGIQKKYHMVLISNGFRDVTSWKREDGWIYFASFTVSESFRFRETLREHNVIFVYAPPCSGKSHFCKMNKSVNGINIVDGDHLFRHTYLKGRWWENSKTRDKVVDLQSKFLAEMSFKVRTIVFWGEPYFNIYTSYVEIDFKSYTRNVAARIEWNNKNPLNPQGILPYKNFVDSLSVLRNYPRRSKLPIFRSFKSFDSCYVFGDAHFDFRTIENDY